MLKGSKLFFNETDLEIKIKSSLQPGNGSKIPESFFLLKDINNECQQCEIVIALKFAKEIF